MGLSVQGFLISRTGFTWEYWEYDKQLSKSLKTEDEELRNGHGRIRALNYGYG